jgi:hypothetical protein
VQSDRAEKCDMKIINDELSEKFVIDLSQVKKFSIVHENPQQQSFSFVADHEFCEDSNGTALFLVEANSES